MAAQHDTFVLQRTYPILPDETAADLETRFAEIGGEMLLEAIDLLGAGTAPLNVPAILSPLSIK